jgi:hypothetical protein
MNPFEAFRWRVSSFRVLHNTTSHDSVPGSYKSVPGPQPSRASGLGTYQGDSWQSPCTDVFHHLCGCVASASHVHDIRVHNGYIRTTNPTAAIPAMIGYSNINRRIPDYGEGTCLQDNGCPWLSEPFCSVVGKQPAHGQQRLERVSWPWGLSVTFKQPVFLLTTATLFGSTSSD